MGEFDRNELSFEQAEGVAPLPGPMDLRHVSPVLRARLWQYIIERVQAEMNSNGQRYNLGPRWGRFYRDYCVKQLAMFADTVNGTLSALQDTLRPFFQRDDYVKVLGTVEWFVRCNSESPSFAASIRRILEEERCAYRLVENSIVPIASPEEGQAVVGALADLDSPRLGGARAHLLKAGSLLTSGDFAGSVRESIHSVESVARTRTGEASLSKALQELQKEHPMHPALIKGFNNIYGYTSDANGIRHPMVGDEGPAVGEPEAIFMLGACASFVTYLARIGGK